MSEEQIQEELREDFDAADLVEQQQDSAPEPEAPSPYTKENSVIQGKGKNEIRLANVGSHKTGKNRGNQDTPNSTELPASAHDTSDDRKRSLSPEEAKKSRDSVVARRGVFVPNPNKSTKTAVTANQSTVRIGRADKSETWRKGKKV